MWRRVWLLRQRRADVLVVIRACGRVRVHVAAWPRGCVHVNGACMLAPTCHERDGLVERSGGRLHHRELAREGWVT